MTERKKKAYNAARRVLLARRLERVLPELYRERLECINPGGTVSPLESNAPSEYVVREDSDGQSVMVVPYGSENATEIWSSIARYSAGDWGEIEPVICHARHYRKSSPGETVYMVGYKSDELKSYILWLERPLYYRDNTGQVEMQRWEIVQLLRAGASNWTRNRAEWYREIKATERDE